MSNLNTNLAIYRTKLANQRTYLAFMRTGFGIASIAGSFKKKWIAAFGALMIILSAAQYVITNQTLDLNKSPTSSVFDIIPVIYLVISLAAVYLQFYK